MGHSRVRIAILRATDPAPADATVADLLRDPLGESDHGHHHGIDFECRAAVPAIGVQANVLGAERGGRIRAHRSHMGGRFNDWCRVTLAERWTTVWTLSVVHSARPGGELGRMPGLVDGGPLVAALWGHADRSMVGSRASAAMPGVAPGGRLGPDDGIEEIIARPLTTTEVIRRRQRVDVRRGSRSSVPAFSSSAGSFMRLRSAVNRPLLSLPGIVLIRFLFVHSAEPLASFHSKGAFACSVSSLRWRTRRPRSHS